MTERKILIVGLGNPEDKYRKNRHNFGFIAIKTLQEKAPLLASPWKFERKFKAEVSTGSYLGAKIYLMMPQTFMNLSGISVALFAGFHDIKPKDIWIIHDDKDMEFGKLRFRDTGSSGGHNGIKSIGEQLGTLNFNRVKFGIQNPLLERMETADFVLSNFTEEEQKEVNIIIEKDLMSLLLDRIRVS